MKKILVTGGAGFIGSNIANALADAGEYRVVVCDIFGEGLKWRNLRNHMLFEIISPVDMFYWLEANAPELEAIIHMGAVSSTTETNVDYILETNFSLSKLLWHWAAENQKRFIYASSAATYGGGEHGFEDDGSLASLSKLKPLNAYGWSKLLFDQYIAASIAAGEATPAQWSGLRFFNVYGPNEYHKDEQASVVQRIFPHAQAGRPVQLFKSYHPDYGDGGQLRDFVYVRDCVDVMKWLLATPNVNGLFNVGTAKARSFADLATSVFAALGKEPEINYISMPETLKPQYQYYTQSTDARLRAAGYAAPFTSLEDGVRDYVQNYLMQPDQYY